MAYPVRAGGDPARDVADALQQIRASGARAKLVVLNYPQNPTGVTVSREQLGELVRVVHEDGALLLHDLAYADLDFSRLAPSIFDAGIDPAEVKKFAVEVFSMSKSYNMPGWRIATMVGNERLIGALSHLKTYMDYGTFIPLQHASAWALDNGDQLVDEIRELYQRRAEVLVRELAGAGWDERGAAERHDVRLGADRRALERVALPGRDPPADRRGARRGRARQRLRTGR